MTDPEQAEALHAWTETAAHVGSKVLSLLYDDEGTGSVVVTRTLEEDGGALFTFERREIIEEEEDK